MPRLLKAALFCGATPLVLGIGIYVSWRFSRAEWLTTAGLINLVAGLVMFLVGVICLSIRSSRTLSGGTPDRSRLSAFRTITWLLLMMNFPAALLIIRSVIIVETRYTVTVINEGNTQIESFIVTGPGIRTDLAPVPPNGKIERHFRFSGDGSLDFETRVGQMNTNGQIDGYVTGNLGGANTVRFKVGGSIEVGQVSR